MSERPPGSKPSKSQRRAAAAQLIIAGMHRSGTSLVASLLQRSGVDIGSDLVPPDQGNEHGFFEDKELVSFHDDILHRGAQRVFVQDTTYLEALSHGDAGRARELIGQRAGKKLWGFKDPRASLFLDFWAELLPRARFVFLFRHPVDVVTSLMRRGSASELEVLVDPLAGLKSWEVHNRAILDFYERYPERSMLCDLYPIVADPDAFIRAVEKKLDLPLNPKKLEDLIHPKDLHSSYGSPRVDSILELIAPHVVELYRELESKADLPAVRPAGREEQPALAKQLDAVASLLADEAVDRVAARPLFAATMRVLDPAAKLVSGRDVRGHLSRADDQIRELRRHAENLEQLETERQAAVRELKRHAAALEDERWKSDERVRKLSDHSQNLEREVEKRESQLADLRTHTTGLEAERRQSRERASELSSHATALESELEQSRGRVAELSAHAAALEAKRQRSRARNVELSAHATALEGERERAEERLAELSAHATALEGERERAEERLAELSAHATALEGVRRRAEERLAELSAHATALEGERERAKERLAELSAHATALEGERERGREQFEKLSEHAANLESGREQAQTRIEGLVRHVENLEAEHERDQERIEGLSVHAANLESDRALARKRAEELARHADNLEAILPGLRQHVANLESDRVRHEARLASQAASIEDLERRSRDCQEQIRVLVSQRSEMDQRLARRDAEVVRLREHASGQQFEIERRAQRWDQLTSSFWVRLLSHLRLIRLP